MQVINTSEGVVNSSDAAVEGGYTISKKNIKDTGMLVRADNAQYGNSFPKGSFNISK